MTGVEPKLFKEMAAILQEGEDRRRLLGGTKARRYGAADRLLMMLEYWREYCTYFHIAKSRSLSKNVIGTLKRFRILAERYRNRRKRFGLRLFLIAAFYNTTLAL